jgi:hypothetical protein
MTDFSHYCWRFDAQSMRHAWLAIEENFGSLDCAGAPGTQGLQRCKPELEACQRRFQLM